MTGYVLGNVSLAILSLCERSVIILYYNIRVLYYNIIILWDHCRICSLSFTETLFCGGCLYVHIIIVASALAVVCLQLCFMLYLPFCPSANSERTDLANSGTSSSNESVSSLPVRDVNNHNNYAPVSPQKSKRGIYQVLSILLAADGQIFLLKTEGARSKFRTEGLYLLGATMQRLGTHVTLAPWIGAPLLGRCEVLTVMTVKTAVS